MGMMSVDFMVMGRPVIVDPAERVLTMRFTP